MKHRKTLIALGIASTLGAGAAAIAASTPYPASIADMTPWTSTHSRQSSMITWDTHGSGAQVGSTSTSAGGTVGATVSGLNGESLSGDQLQLSGTTTDDGATMALANEGVYSDFYTVSAVPAYGEQWDYYVITPSASEDFYVISPMAMSDEVYILSPGSYSVMTFYPSSSFDAETGFSSEPAM